MSAIDLNNFYDLTGPALPVRHFVIDDERLDFATRFCDKILLLANLLAAAVITQKTEKKLRCRRTGRQYVCRDISVVYLLILLKICDNNQNINGRCLRNPSP